MKATLAACALLAASLLASVARLTQGYEHWTFEALRREAAREGRLQLPATALRGSNGPLAAGPAGVRVVDFIYTRCESVCLALGAEFFQMQQSLRADEGVRLLSISIDPEQDGAPELAAYSQRFRADATRWTVAAPQSPVQGREALRALGVVAVPDGLGGYVHNGALHVVDAAGRVRGIYDYADWPAALAAARRFQ